LQRILVIDDDPGITRLLKRGLSLEGFAVDTADSGEAGLRLVFDRPPDLVILDWMMPGLDGIEVLRRLREADQHLPVLMLTARDAPADQVQGLRTGADDFVAKPFTFDVLLARIEVLLRRRDSERPSILRFADLVMDTGAFTVLRSGRSVTLTSLEFKLLLAFMENPRHVFSKETLLDRVWGGDFFGSTNVVEVYVKQLRQKLEAEGEQRLLHTIRGAGYVLREG
jgi:DNA-binding response OmpR family regulator